MAHLPSTSKTVKFGDKDYETTLWRWFNEDDDDASDVDQVELDCALDCDHDSNSEQSASEAESNEATDMELDDNQDQKRNLGSSVRAAGLIEENDNPEKIWNLFFDDEIIKTLVCWTNMKIKEVAESYKNKSLSQLKEVDILEMRAFLGLLIYTAVFKSNREKISTIFATDGTEIYFISECDG
nr:unnamed protein product [Callosobruchus analis]